MYVALTPSRGMPLERVWDRRCGAICPSASRSQPEPRCRRWGSSGVTRLAKQKRCSACGVDKPRAQFRVTKSGRPYRSCSDCHVPHSEAAHPRAYYKSPEYKSLCRERVAQKQRRQFRPGICGRPPGYAKPKHVSAETLAQREWSAWLKRAPSDWVVSYQAARLEAARQADCIRSRRYHASNQAKSRERIKRYKNANPDMVARAGARRWQRASEQSDGTVTAAQVSAILRSRRRCPYCLVAITPQTAQLDHIVPLAGMGVHGVVNLVPCCAPCNLRKSDRPYAEWVGMLEGKARAAAVGLYEARYGPLEQGLLI